jgi:hypothetical protein
MLSPDLAAGIHRVKGAKRLGVRWGNWLNADQSKELICSLEITSGWSPNHEEPVRAPQMKKTRPNWRDQRTNMKEHSRAVCVFNRSNS